MSYRGERQFLWFLTLLVGIALCWFSTTGSGRLLFLAPGLGVVIFSAIRLRRLRRRRSRVRNFD
jgi:hypothetical protein